MDWSVGKVAVIWLGIVLLAAAIVIPCVIGGVREDGRNIKARQELRIACIQSGQSVVSGNCVPIVKAVSP